jgi:uncharacterized protein YunC (DUF1805 family)
VTSLQSPLAHFQHQMKRTPLWKLEEQKAWKMCEYISLRYQTPVNSGGKQNRERKIV